MGLMSYWHYINLSNEKQLLNLINSRGDLFSPNVQNVEYGIDNNFISDYVNNAGCNEEGIKSVADSKKTKPLFLGFTKGDYIASDDDEVVYKNVSKNNYLNCFFEYQQDNMTGETFSHVEVSPTIKKYIGVNKDLTQVYFSATGKSWTAYYSYDIKVDKIAKTTLANINKNKIKLTLVKKF